MSTTGITSVLSSTNFMTKLGIKCQQISLEFNLRSTDQLMSRTNSRIQNKDSGQAVKHVR